jgi:CRISPR-associated protein (TIGR03986 family)
MSIKSPYNFVPAPTEEQVYKPHWADQVSHDIPFSDGESGEITFTIEAKTPIFIRNGQAKTQPDEEFSHIIEGNNKRYFIPATSIKGMVRNVLEIMSFGRMDKDLVNNDRYAFRDLSNGSLYLDEYKTNQIKGGWLHKDDNENWYIVECTNLAFITHKELDIHLTSNFQSEFTVDESRKEKGKPDKNLNGDVLRDKTGKYKYTNLTRGQNLTQTFICQRDKYNKLTAQFDSNGEEGHIVFTGQSGLRNETEKNGKYNEFVFFGSKTEGNRLQLSDAQKRDFKFIYYNDLKNESKDWKFWKGKLAQNIPVPVFYSTSEDANQVRHVAHFGLAYMYKLPFKKSIHETFPISEYGTKKDLATVMFGHTDKEDSLKGRVMFSHAFSQNATLHKPEEPQKEILATPKASYYPFYLDQLRADKKYNTYQDESATLRGFKRYPVRNKHVDTHYTIRYSQTQINNPNVFASFKPLDIGTKFDFKVRYHNLKKVELGALISAITFHNNPKFNHSLGGAKPFGYGKIKVSVKNIIQEQLNTIDDFENLMNAHCQAICSRKWFETEQMIQLFSMATTPKKDDYLVYPSLQGGNDFVRYKNQTEFLGKYSVESGLQINIRNQDELEEMLANATSKTFSNFTELRNWVKTEYDDNLPESLQEMICNAILLTKTDKESRKTLTKKGFDANPWQFPIIKWLGETKAQELHNKITHEQ